jgi:hypothetical protein
MVRERAKNAAVTGGRDYARKPLSLKMGLAMAPTVGTARKRSKYVMLLEPIDFVDACFTFY